MDRWRYEKKEERERSERSNIRSAYPGQRGDKGSRLKIERGYGRTRTKGEAGKRGKSEVFGRSEPKRRIRQAINGRRRGKTWPPRRESYVGCSSRPKAGSTIEKRKERTCQKMNVFK